MAIEHDELWLQCNASYDAACHGHQIKTAKRYHNHMMSLMPADEWDEDMGDVLWFHLPLQEAPYVGSPLDETWGDVWPSGETAATWYTHFQLITVKED